MSDIANAEAVATVATDGRKSRRKSSRRARAEERPIISLWRPANQARIDLLVCGLTALAIFIAGLTFIFDRGSYPAIALGVTPTEVRYGFGEPSAKRTDGNTERWDYVYKGTTHFVTFVDGHAKTVGCTAHDDQTDCPAFFGFDTATIEDRLLAQIGVPEQQVIANGVKRSSYSALGLDFELEQFQVRSIELHADQPGFFSKLYRFLLLILP